MRDTSQEALAELKTVPESVDVHLHVPIYYSKANERVAKVKNSVYQPK